MPAESGLSADGVPWSVLLSRADRAGLVTLVRENLFRFTERDVLQALRHPHLSAPVIEDVLASRTFLAARPVRKALALHPATPRHAALRCLDDLAWRDLMDVGRERRTPPPVRRAANGLLRTKLTMLSMGEKIALARLADRELLAALLAEREPAIFAAILTNPRLTEDDLVRWITVGSPDAPRLALVAENRSWRERPGVRSALLRCKTTPRPVALALLPNGTRAEWRGLLSDPFADPLLAACAERLLEEGVDTLDKGTRRS